MNSIYILDNKDFLFFDPQNKEALNNLINKYCKNKNCFYGLNSEIEKTVIGFFEDRAEVATYQKNHWIRNNIYYKNGDTEEFFEGKW